MLDDGSTRSARRLAHKRGLSIARLIAVGAALIPISWITAGSRGFAADTANSPAIGNIHHVVAARVDDEGHPIIPSVNENENGALVADPDWVDWTNEFGDSSNLSDDSTVDERWQSLGPTQWGCCSVQPLWTVRAGAVFLQRQGADPYAILTDTDGIDTFLDAADYHFGSYGGPDISAIRALTACDALEVRYFGVDGWTARQSGALPNIVRLNTATPVLFVGASSLNSTYSSQLFSTEVNWRRQRFENLTLLAGFRTVELDDTWQADVVGTGGGSNIAITRTHTANRLYGFQLGAESRLWQYGCVGIDGIVKAGVYGNTARHRSVIESPPDVIALGPIADRGTRTAFVGDIGLTGVYQITDRLAVRGGYQLLWVEGVAVASEQVRVANFTTNSGIDLSNGVFYHGAVVNVEYIW